MSDDQSKPHLISELYKTVLHTWGNSGRGNPIFLLNKYGSSYHFNYKFLDKKA